MADQLSYTRLWKGEGEYRVNRDIMLFLTQHMMPETFTKDNENTEQDRYS